MNRGARLRLEEPDADSTQAFPPRFTWQGWCLVGGGCVGLLSVPGLNVHYPSPAWMGLLFGLCGAAGAVVWAPAAWIYVLRAERRGVQPRAAEWLLLAALTVAACYMAWCVMDAVTSGA
jgi:hypothetical protein